MDWWKMWTSWAESEIGWINTTIQVRYKAVVGTVAIVARTIAA